MSNAYKKNLNGFGLLEIIIASTLISVSLFSLAAVGGLALKSVSESLNGIKAGYLAEEGIEVLRLLRDNNWNNISSLTLNQPHYLIFSGGSWQATTSPQLIDGFFSRSFSLEQVLRDGEDNIAPSGNNDPSSRKIVLRLSWRGKSREFISYITNLFGN